MPGVLQPGTRPGAGGRFARPPRPDLLRPRSTWRWWEAILVYMGGLLVAGFAAIPALALVKPEGTAEIVANIVFALVELAILVVWLQRFHPEWRAAMVFPSRSRFLPEIGAGLWRGIVLFLVVTYGVGLALTLLFDVIFGKTISTPEQLPAHLGGLGRSLAVLYAVGLAPIAEEFFFRGCLFRTLRDRHGFGIAAVASAFTFGLVHYVPAPFVDSLLLMAVMVFTGLALAFIYDRRGTIVASMGAHMMFNAIAITLIFMTR
jgi:membrane protease YdiL (CAAX protease family)